MHEHPSRDLLRRARIGEPEAIGHLLEWYRAALRRWAHGRLPRWARDMADTEDLLQETLTQTFKHLPRIELKDEAALLAYLRHAVLNRIRNELRRAWRHPGRAELADSTPDGGASPLEAAIKHERMQRYENALAALSVSDREAIIGRLELGLPYSDLAVALRKPTADAARLAVTRAMVRLVSRMRELGAE